MARPKGPRFKLVRHLGINVFNHPKALKRELKPHKKLSEYGQQLLEKQKLKAYYGIMEKQFKGYVQEALKSKEVSEEYLIQKLERRLDNLVYKIGFGFTLRQARQMVVHNHILVNDKKVNIPSFIVNIGDVISLKEKSRKTEIFTENFNSSLINLAYIDKDKDNYSGRLITTPTKVMVPILVKFSKVFEFYTKN